jgi:hypothetical protein
MRNAMAYAGKAQRRVVSAWTASPSPRPMPRQHASNGARRLGWRETVLSVGSRPTAANQSINLVL